MAKIMIYTDWESCIGHTENKLDWEVGEFTHVNDKHNPGKGKRVMVYANLELDELGLEVVKYVFSNSKLTKNSKFYEVLNSIVEQIISLNKDGYGEVIVKEREEARLRHEAVVERWADYFLKNVRAY